PCVATTGPIRDGAATIGRPGAARPAAAGEDPRPRGRCAKSRDPSARPLARPPPRSRSAVPSSPMPAIVSPVDGQIAFTYENLDLDAALARLARAEAAQREWAKTTIAERAALLLRMLDRYNDHLGAHAEKITRMMGKPLAQARGEF